MQAIKVFGELKDRLEGANSKYSQIMLCKAERPAKTFHIIDHLKLNLKCIYLMAVLGIQQ